MSSINFSIYRYNPDLQQKPRMQHYTLQVEGDMMLLDALIALKEQDETLSFRRSCREGVCGSDGMNVNGKNILACITPLSAIKRPIIIRPLPGLPVVKDLIVDMQPFYRQYEKARPYLINETIAPPRERLQTPKQREKLDGLYECILCACCTSACPSYWWNPDKFLGPAALLWLCRFLLDSRDTDREARLTELNDLFRLFRCRTIMNCTSVCPKHLNPAKAIGVIRQQLIEEEV
jgi:succinate dehydrogenase / fumarate reductase, iron-sulfur subunit